MQHSLWGQVRLCVIHYGGMLQETVSPSKPSLEDNVIPLGIQFIQLGLSVVPEMYPFQSCGNLIPCTT